MRLLIVLFAFLALANATTHYKETFDDGWEKRWVVSNWKKNEGTAGEWKWTSGDWYGDESLSKGIATGPDARFYAISSKFAHPVSLPTESKDLVLQFSVKHPQSIDCGGGYIKLLPASVETKTFGGDSDYFIMFGPDVCGTSTRKIHTIFNYKGKNHLWKKTPSCETDQLSHVYTLIVHGDFTYEVRVDGRKVESGSVIDDWDMLPPKMIKDPNAAKPKDWVDQEFIDDPSDVKPADWDSVPKQIPDPDADKPEDWDDDTDGTWEPPMIDNPEYKGEWKPKQKSNPDYKGKWVHPEIANPDYEEDRTLAHYSDIGAVGFELWQVKSGSLFDNILVTDSVAEADAFLAETFTKFKDAEKTMFDAAQKKKRDDEEAARKKTEEAAKKDKKPAAADDDDEDEDDDDSKKGKEDL